MIYKVIRNGNGEKIMNSRLFLLLTILGLLTCWQVTFVGMDIDTWVEESYDESNKKNRNCLYTHFNNSDKNFDKDKLEEEKNITKSLLKYEFYAFIDYFFNQFSIVKTKKLGYVDFFYGTTIGIYKQIFKFKRFDLYLFEIQWNWVSLISYCIGFHNLNQLYVCKCSANQVEALRESDNYFMSTFLLLLLYSCNFSIFTFKVFNNVTKISFFNPFKILFFYKNMEDCEILPEEYRLLGYFKNINGNFYYQVRRFFFYGVFGAHVEDRQIDKWKTIIIGFLNSIVPDISIDFST